MGMSGSNYAGYWSAMKAHDGYLMVNGGDLAIGTDTSGNVINFFTDGMMSGNLRATMDDTKFETTAGVKIKENGFNLTDLITTAANASEEAAAFSAGSKIVIRTDLL